MARCIARWMVAMISVAAVSACASPAGSGGSNAPAVGSPAVVTGRLVLRGNEPVTYPVVYAGSAIWELQGVAHDAAVRLQNHSVTAEGTISRIAADTGLLPALKVSRLTDNGAAP